MSQEHQQENTHSEKRQLNAEPRNFEAAVQPIDVGFAGQAGATRRGDRLTFSRILNGIGVFALVGAVLAFYGVLFFASSL
jgi:hypothetical protein